MQQTIDRGFEYAPQTKPIAREAIISAIYAMLSDWVRKEGVETLPEIAPLVIYTILCPFIGPEEAATIANGGRGAR